MRKIFTLFFTTFLCFISFAQGHFTVAFSGNGQDQMNINILLATADGLALGAGDEIAVFDGNICCGKVVLTQPIIFSDMNTFVSIAASKKDDGMSNGFTVGNSITYKFWDTSASQEISLVTPEYLDPGTGLSTTAPTYTANGSVFVKLIGTSNKIPVANAGADQTVNEGGTVILDGSASSDPDSNPLTYKWTAPAGIFLSSSTAAKPTFIAPEVSSNKTYTFSLVVNDGTVDSQTDRVDITVKNIEQKGHFTVAFSGNGQDQMNINILFATADGLALGAGDEIAVFDGNVCCGKVVLTQPIIFSDMNTFVSIAASKKDDGMSNGFTVGNAISYKFWNTSASQEISLVTPEYLDPGTGLSTTAPTYTANGSVFVKLISTSNKIPVANAGADQTVNEGVTVTLDGSASTDPDSNPLTYKWTAPAGITLSSTTDAKPTFVAPDVSVDTDYTFKLVVNDGIIESQADEVVVKVKFVVGLKPIKDAIVEIYPNPVKNMVNIRFDSEPMAGTLITVYDFTGKVVLKSIASGKETSLNLSSLQVGPYFIKIDQQTSKTYKVVKE